MSGKIRCERNQYSGSSPIAAPNDVACQNLSGKARAAGPNRFDCVPAKLPMASALSLTQFDTADSPATAPPGCCVHEAIIVITESAISTARLFQIDLRAADRHDFVPFGKNVV